MNERLPAHALREITRVEAERAELDTVNAALEQEHFLGAVTPNNRNVVKLALHHNQVVAIDSVDTGGPETGGVRSVDWVGRPHAHAPLGAARAEQPLLGSLESAADQSGQSGVGPGHGGASPVRLTGVGPRLLEARSAEGN